MVGVKQGTGPRLHTLAPDVTLDAIGHPPSEDIFAASHEFVRQEEGRLPVLGILLCGGEALFGSPARDMLHDGSMKLEEITRTGQPSQAVLASVEMPPFNTCMSVV